MSNEITLTSIDGSGDAGGPAPAAPADGRQRTELFHRLHRILRGRYALFIPLAVVGAVIGAIVGYSSQKPIFRAEGIVRILSSRPQVLKATDENQIITMYEEYIQSQALLINGRKVIDTAMDQALHDPVWAAVDRKSLPATSDDFTDNLIVEHPPRTEAITISYSDPDAKVAAVAVNAVIDSYANIYSADEDNVENTRIKLLDEQRRLLNIQIQSAQEKIDSVTQRYQAPDLKPLYDIRLQEVTKLEAQFVDAKLALSMADKELTPEQAAQDLTNNQIAMLDPMMKEKMASCDSLDLEIQRNRARMGPNNPAVMQEMTELDAARKSADQYAREYRELQIRMAHNSGARPGGIPVLVENVESLTQQRNALEDMVKEAKERMSAIGGDLLIMDRAQDELDGYRKDLSEIDDRIKSLNLESRGGNRLRISKAEVPATPYKDRRKAWAAVGGLGGSLLPFFVFLLIGFFDPRFRYSEDAEAAAGSPPLLGILPTLPHQLSDPEQAAVAAHCIHQIRIMLQLGSASGKGRAYMITSAGAGDGKTSLTMALGLSFAASGSRTLVVDADMVGQGLTRRFKAGKSPGLLEALSAGSLQGLVTKTATPGLWILPVGLAESAHAGELSSAGIHALLAEARQLFDVVIIDTGPILGSLEAAVIAPEADQVILTVARGQQQPLLHRSLRHCRAIGANVAGLVFNRAEGRDFHRSVASASMRSLNASPSSAHPVIAESEESSRFGPLARSVASFIPSRGATLPADDDDDNNGKAQHQAAPSPTAYFPKSPDSRNQT